MLIVNIPLKQNLYRISLFVFLILLNACSKEVNLPISLATSIHLPSPEPKKKATTATEGPSTQTPWIKTPNDTIIIDILPDGGPPFLPNCNFSFTNRLILPAIYGELVRMDAKGEYFPYLAQTAPTIENGSIRFVGEGEDKQLEVEFQLHPNVEWQDGQPLTADDITFSWELVMNPN